MSELGRREQALIQQYPTIDWLAPMSASVAGGARRLICRMCAAFHGLKASELETVGFETREEFRVHLNAVHVRQEVGR